MQMPTDGYTYRVAWSPEDREHVGLCQAFPSLSWLAATADQASRGIRQLVREVVADLKTCGEEIPAPLSRPGLQAATERVIPGPTP